MTQELIKRFRYLWVFEVLNAVVVFPGFVLLVTRNARSEIGAFALLMTALVSFLLLVGAGFTFLKYQDLRHETHRLTRFEALFRLLRRVVPLLLVVGGVLFVAELLTLGTSYRFLGLMLGTFMLIMAVLEYINYFHLQLMYDNRRDLAYLLTKRKLKQGLIAREYGW